MSLKPSIEQPHSKPARTSLTSSLKRLSCWTLPQRTVATAQFFITGAFPGCDIPVHHQEKMGTMDPTFNPVITDDSAAFSEQAVAAMEKELSKLQLTDSYKLLEQIVNYKDSPACKEKQQCSLVDGKNTFSAK